MPHHNGKVKRLNDASSNGLRQILCSIESLYARPTKQQPTLYSEVVTVAEALKLKMAHSLDGVSNVALKEHPELPNSGKQPEDPASYWPNVCWIPSRPRHLSGRNGILVSGESSPASRFISVKVDWSRCLGTDSQSPTGTARETLALIRVPSYGLGLFI